VPKLSVEYFQTKLNSTIRLEQRAQVISRILPDQTDTIRLEQRAQVISRILPDQTEQFNIIVFCNKTKYFFYQQKLFKIGLFHSSVSYHNLF